MTALRSSVHLYVCDCLSLSVCLSVCVEEHASHLHLPVRIQHLNPGSSHINRHLHHLQKVRY